MTDIKYITHKDIDFIMWDRCIARSHNGNVFGFSWFLDSVCETWDALVLGNYNAVMPLPVRRKFGFSSILNPRLLSKTNIYLSKELDSEVIERFLNSIPSKFKFVEIKTGNQNLHHTNFNVKQSRSYKLDLISSYNHIKKAYSENFIENLNITNTYKTFYNTGILPNGIVLLSRLGKDLNKRDADKLRLLAAVSARRKLGEIYGAFNNKNRLFAAALFISSHYKTYVIYAVQTKEAQKRKAIYGLIDHYIKTHSEKALTLDFSGLNMMSSDFFKNIGATEYPYYILNKKKKILF